MGEAEEGKVMSRLYSHCPDCKAEVAVASVGWNGAKDTPASFHAKADCPACGKSFDVYAVNATVVQENIRGV